MEAKGVKFLVLPKDALDLSWQIPVSDFFTTGSAACATQAHALINAVISNLAGVSECMESS
jgi:hypothetical protein